jgi:hypothetical protein
VGKMNQVRPLERLLEYTETEMGLKASVLESRIRMIMMMVVVVVIMMLMMIRTTMTKTWMMMTMNSGYLLGLLSNLTCFFHHQCSTYMYYHQSVLFTLCQCNRYVKHFVM